MLALTMVLLLGVVNLIAMQYGRGAVRTALDEGARYGALLGNDGEDCEQRAEMVLRGDSGLLRGTLGDSITVTCQVVGDTMRATAVGTFDWWVGGLPPVEFTMIGDAVAEQPP
ncbi:MAG: hypothetical protein QNJ88_12415 [Acidimicrobiia bacterium]|nr:hypothetical protein [Acidimicrobiia bacterium]